MKKFSSVVLIMFSLLMISNAYAGGLQSGTSAALTIRDWSYGFLGVAAAIYLMWKGACAWAEKCQWIDFIFAIFKVAGVGGSIALATWAWGLAA